MKFLFVSLGFFLLVPVLAYAQVSVEVPLEQQLEELQELENQLDHINAQLDTFEPVALPAVSSQEVRATVTSIIADTTVDGVRQMIFIAEADDESYTVDTSQSYLDGLRYDIRIGNDVYLQVTQEGDDIIHVFLVDVVRTKSLVILATLFTCIILVIGRWRGLAALFGLGVTFGVLFLFLLPAILGGANPVVTTVIASLIILAVNMHVSHGFTKNTLLAFTGTASGLGLVVLFSMFFVRLAQLSGMASEEAVLLQYNADAVAAPHGILLAAIILGAVGVLDDIAITQSETVAELSRANPDLSRTELFSAAMRVGRHHIASTVNTLVLAYVGVALPLLLLFLHTQGVSPMRFLTEEPVVEEIVRTVAGTLGLVLTVPIATWLATWGKGD